VTLMTKTILLVSIVVGSILLGGTLHENAFAAVDMFLKIEGIDGEATDKKHKGEIDVLSWSWGMSQSGSSGSGETGKVNVQDFSYTKFIDKSTPKIYEKLSSGKHIPTIELSISDKKYSGKQTYLKYTLTNVLVTSVSTGGSGGEDRPTENITLNFAEIKVTYQQFVDKKKSGPEIEFTLIPSRIE